LNPLENIETYPIDYRVNQFLLDKVATISDLEDYLKNIYSSSVGVEFEHVHSEDERLWLYENYEKVMHEPLTS